MSKVERIEAEIAKLAPQEVRQLARWLAERDAKLWDEQIEKDAESGQLDFLFEEADAQRKKPLRKWPPDGK